MAKEKALNSRRANPEEWGVLTVRCSDEGCSDNAALRLCSGPWACL